MSFVRAEPEYNKGLDGFADIVVFDNHNRPWLVIEAKKKLQITILEILIPILPK
jgi:hypothetical protein